MDEAEIKRPCPQNQVGRAFFVFLGFCQNSVSEQNRIILHFLECVFMTSPHGLSMSGGEKEYSMVDSNHQNGGLTTVTDHVFRSA